MENFDTWWEDFSKKMSSLDKEIRKKEREAAKRREHISNVWKSIERELDKIQGSERSTAFRTLACFSLSECPMGSKLWDECIAELTDAERKLIIGK